MDPGLLRDVLTVALGVFTGMMSALFGVGGAVVSTPGIRALGASAILAVGTTLPSIIPSAVSGTLRYVRERMVDWRVVAWTVPTGIAASVGGSVLSHVIPGNGHLLMIFTAGLLAFTAWRMGRAPTAPPRPDTEAEAEAEGVLDASAVGGVRVRARHDSPPVLAGIGVMAGGLSGLLGIGGGIAMVPAFTELIKLPLKTAIATSLVCVGAFAVPGTIAHAVLGDIDWRFAILLAVGVVPGARLGAALAIRTPTVRLRVAVAVFLGLIAVLYAGGEIAALIGN